MSRPDDHDLIDRHLAGILEPDEVARLETLIRTSPAWARKYRAAEEMARVLHAHVGDGGAPTAAKRSIARALRETPEPGTALRRRSVPRTWLVAASLLFAVAGAYLFTPGLFGGDGDDGLPLVYANDPLPLKDLARLASIGVVGEVVQRGGMLRLQIEDTLFGEAPVLGFALPEGLHPGQRVALFATPNAAGDMLEVVGGKRGVIHLDGMQQWGAGRLAPAETQARVARARDVRSRDAALADLRTFLGTGASRTARRADDGLLYSGAVTARYLGRFPIRHIREDLLRLVHDLDKVPAARTAAGHALIESDPQGASRDLVREVLAKDPHTLRGESEDGQVAMACLDLVMRHGPADTADDLRTLAGRIQCPALAEAAEAAAKAVTGAGPRDVAHMQAPAPQRLRLRPDGPEAMVAAGCEGRREGLLVIFRSEHALRSLRLPINLTIGHGTGVLVLPPGVRDVDPWIRAAAGTNLVDTQQIRFLGVGRAAGDALAASARRAPDVLYLMADRSPERPSRGADGGLRIHLFAADVRAPGQVGGWNLHPTEGTLSGWLRNEKVLEQVLATD